MNNVTEAKKLNESNVIELKTKRVIDTTDLSDQIEQMKLEKEEIYRKGLMNGMWYMTIAVLLMVTGSWLATKIL